ncbi:DegT/DnrJ/EryC1/StrS family aminotransferase [Longitalea arenae]|uniref:DegT/DnrJ/EryC1/StrS family aminotransferase n=1 Tax=Longitalea arenae TaxID=2812558 RepID=UPI001967139D|nr:DegT/DnrJ/EryC1/StrS family aminotransferase [Longitalea arenae]
MYYARRLSIWPTLPLNVHFRQISNWQPFPLNVEGCRVYSRARHAIWNACRTLGLGNDDVVLVPDYHHGCEIEALLQAGVKIRYYEVTELLEPDPQKLDDMLTPDVKVLYLIHYLGFPQDAFRWRQWCDERGLLLFEDAAQAFLAEIDNRPVGTFGHAGVFCLYKTYGIPDGGAVVTNIPPALPKSKYPSGRWGVLKRHVNWIAERSAVIGSIHLYVKPMMKKLKKKSHNPHKEFDLGDPFTLASSLTMRLLPRLVDQSTARRRRENYKFLLEHHRHLVPRPFQTLPEGASPFAFPVEVDDADEVLKKLRRYGVEGLLFWRNAHPSLPVDDFPNSKAFRNRVFAVPVHQELTASELMQVTEALHRATTKQLNPITP